MRSPRSAAGRLVDRDRWRVVRLVWRTSPGLLIALVVDAVALAVAPNAVLVALGVTIGRIPPAIDAGFDSPAGDRLVQALAILLGAFVLALVVGPVHVALGRFVRARLTGEMQARLMRAVAAPTGIGHLEDPATAEQIELARGSLMSWDPADAPTALALVWSKRLTDLFAYSILSSFIWWLGPLLFVTWTTTRRPILRVIKGHIAALGGQADLMRRAEHLRRLSVAPSAAKELRVFGLGHWVVGRYRDAWVEGMGHVWAIRADVHRVIWAVGAALLVVYTGATGYAAWAAWDGRLAPSDLAIVVTLLALTRQSSAVDFDDIALLWRLSAFPHLDEVVERLGEPRPEPPGADPAPAPAPPRPLGSIRFEGVTFAYPAAPDRPVLRGLDLTLEAGRSTAVVGANGSGKTTLIKLLTRLYEPAEGRITVDGEDIRSFDPEAWRGHVALMLQDFLRLPVPAADAVGLGAVEHLADRKGIEAAAAAAGVDGVIEGLPGGWSTMLAPGQVDGVALSDGQWQRVALARSLFAARHGASVLVLDEPTSWMDIRGESDFFARFLELTEGLTTLIISHRFSTVRLADHIVVVADGRIVERGSHDELLAEGGRYARMFRLQAARFRAGADVVPP